MRKGHFLFYLIVFGVLFSGCQSSLPENNQININKSGNNRNTDIAAINKTVNENSAFNSSNANDLETNTNDKAHFEGTAGIVEKKYEIQSVAVLSKVRTARHDGFDRAVFEFETAEMPGYHVEYIDKPVRQCGSGNPVNLQGDGWLEIRFQPAQAHTEEGKPTIENREQSPNLKIIKQLKLTCDFEADVTWVLGVASPNKYRVLEIKNPTRLAVDIKH